MLKLYSHSVSQFSARVWIALRAKNIPCEDLGVPEPGAPHEGLRTAKYLAINPMGKIPVLVLEDGHIIVESEAILDYLEQVYPTPPLQPTDPLQRAAMNMAIRVCETYVSAPMLHMFEYLDPAANGEAVLTAEGANLTKGLAYLAHFVSDARYAVGPALSLADCVYFPTLQLAQLVGGRFGHQDILTTQPTLAGYFAKAQGDAILGDVDRQLRTAFVERMAKAKG